MRPTLVIAALAALSLTAACSAGDHDKASADAKDVGHSVDSGAKTAETDVKQAGHTVATDFRKLAAEAKTEAHKLATDTRGAAHNVTHHDRSDNHS